MRSFCVLPAVAFVLLVQVTGHCSNKFFCLNETVESFRLDQKAVQAQFVYDPMLACRSAGLHGLVKKEGYGLENMFWNDVTHFAKQEHFIFHGLPVYTSCQVRNQPLRHEYNLISKYNICCMTRYMLVQKSASTSHT